MVVTTKPVRDKIVELQYLRAVAVLLVVIGHIHQTEGRFFGDELFGGFAYFGFSGVDVFFVISGFIIHHIYGKMSGFRPRFFISRLNRIFPLYWIYTAIAVVGLLLVNGAGPDTALGQKNWLATATLYPVGYPPILPVGWTLTHELYFYIAYAIYLALPTRARPWAVLGWAGLTLGGVFGLADGRPPLVGLLISPFNLLFLAGALIAQFSDRLLALRRTALAVTIAGATLGLIWTGNYGLDGLSDPAIRVPVFAPFAIGTVWAVLAWRPRLPVLAARIGDWSYACYLGHILVLEALARVLAPTLSGSVFASPVYYTLGMLGALTLAWLSHRLVERPLLRLGKMVIAASMPKPRPVVDA
ncbi:acyltransferase [uncultured Maricaulis sp.]|uniref:acyltransferase family protein n=1 Tax=uncultured Maricaulis sp. TaxID=174710 RepID=UPI0030DA142D|tara:strand:- start:3183 stop:4256 length:1074 start_codon:yes stop_codon:yes gene_type:complete